MKTQNNNRLDESLSKIAFFKSLGIDTGVCINHEILTLNQYGNIQVKDIENQD